MNQNQIDDFIEWLGKFKSITDLEYCFAMGKDCEINGANQMNCDFRIFGTPEGTAAWQAGHDTARKEKDLNASFPKEGGK